MDQVWKSEYLVQRWCGATRQYVTCKRDENPFEAEMWGRENLPAPNTFQVVEVLTWIGPNA